MDDLCDLALTSIRLRVIPSSCRHQRDVFTQVSCERLSCRFANETKRDVAVSAWLRPASGFCFPAAARWGLLSQVSGPHSPKENEEIRVSPSLEFLKNNPHISMRKRSTSRISPSADRSCESWMKQNISKIPLQCCISRFLHVSFSSLI